MTNGRLEFGRLTFGEVLGSTFVLWWRNLGTLALLMLVPALLGFGAAALSVLYSHHHNPLLTLSWDGMSAGMATAHLLLAAASGISAAIVSGAAVAVVLAAARGERVGFTAAFSAALPLWWRFVLSDLCALAIVAVPAAIGIGGGVGLGLMGARAHVGGDNPMLWPAGIVGAVGLLCAAVFAVHVSLVTPVVQEERPWGWRAIRRSMHIVQVNAWRVFGASLIIGLLVSLKCTVGYNTAGGKLFWEGFYAALWILRSPLLIVLTAVLYGDLRARLLPPEPEGVNGTSTGGSPTANDALERARPDGGGDAESE